MCTINQKDFVIEESIIGYKVFRVIDGAYYSMFKCYRYDSSWERRLITPPYDPDNVNVCDSDDGFHAFADMAMAQELVRSFRNQGIELAIFRVRMNDIFKIGTWSEGAAYVETNPTVYHCRELFMLDQIQKDTYKQYELF